VHYIAGVRHMHKKLRGRKIKNKVENVEKKQDD
jgi:hypothetical protein